MTGERVLSAVAAHFKIKVADLIGPARHHAYSYPRAIAMYLMRRLINSVSYVRIGVLCGGRDHSTVMTAVRKIARLLIADEQTVIDVGAIQARLQALRSPAQSFYLVFSREIARA